MSLIMNISRKFIYLFIVFKYEVLKYSRFLFLAHPNICVCVCYLYDFIYDQARRKQVNMGEGGRGRTNISSGYDVMFHLNIFKAKIPSLLIRFIMTFDGKIQD